VKAVKVTDRLSIGPQPNLGDFSDLRAQGFAAVVNNRPDGEERSQPTSDDASIEAETVGLTYVRQPVTLGRITESDVRKFQQENAKLEGPVFARCKSGTRSLTLWTLGEVLDGRLQPSQIIPFGKQFGVDLKAAGEWAVKSINTSDEKR
jgi:uncharacterized protein (TIGR01244 family)